jgi:hypothetical protein
MADMLDEERVRQMLHSGADVVRRAEFFFQLKSVALVSVQAYTLADRPSFARLGTANS